MVCTDVYTEHSHQTTVCKQSPSGFYNASADSVGNVCYYSYPFWNKGSMYRCDSGTPPKRHIFWRINSNSLPAQSAIYAGILEFWEKNGLVINNCQVWGFQAFGRRGWRKGTIRACYSLRHWNLERRPLWSISASFFYWYEALPSLQAGHWFWGGWFLNVEWK